MIIFHKNAYGFEIRHVDGYHSGSIRKTGSTWFYYTIAQDDYLLSSEDLREIANKLDELNKK